MKSLIISGIIFSWLSCGSSSLKNNSVISSHADSIPVRTDSLIKTKDTLSFIAVGDIMFGSNFPDMSEMPPNDGKDLLKYFSGALQDADITFGNAEGVFMDAGGRSKGSGENVYCFRQPVRYANYFTENGFDLISVANNHVADFGDVGMRSTISALKALPVNFAGMQNYPTCIFKVRNLTIGMAAFAPHKGCIQMNDLAAAVAAVKKLKKQCDIVFVSFHGGAEGKNATHVPKKKELFYGQNRGDVYQFAHNMIDAGADIVIGHGPHVARAMEVYNNKFIAYSLGNFCTYGMFNLEGVNGIAPLLKIYTDEKGDFIKGTITSIKQEGEGGPLPDDNYGAYKLIRSLTLADIPNSHLAFPDSIAIIKE